MPKENMHPFRGGEVTGTELTRKVSQAVHELGLTSISGVAYWMGPEWFEPIQRRQLGVILNNLTRPGKPVERIDGIGLWRGIFTPRECEFGVAVNRADRNDIDALKALRMSGGIATFMEWFQVTYPETYADAHDTRQNCGMTPTAFLHNSTDWQRMAKSARRLVKTGQVCRDYSNGASPNYNLPKAELGECVGRGKWVARTMLVDDPRIKRLSGEERKDLRDLALMKIGSAFREAREAAGLTIAEVIADADVSASIDNDWDLSDERNLLRWELPERVRNEAITVGKYDDHEWQLRVQKEMDDCWRERLLWRFEQFAGRDEYYCDSTWRSMGGHLDAPASFYWAVAAKLGVDAPALSRGGVIALV